MASEDAYTQVAWNVEAQLVYSGGKVSGDYVDHELFTNSTSSSEPLHTLSTDFPHFHKCSSRGPEKVLYLFGAFRNTIWPPWSRHFPELLYINMKSPDLPEIFLLRVLKKCLTFGRDSKYKMAALTSDLQRHLVL